MKRLFHSGAHETFHYIPIYLAQNSYHLSGEALALAPPPHRPWVVVIPFALPGEKLLARVYRNSRLHSFADLIKIITPNPDLRDPDRIKCRYFGSCSGCQYQVGLNMRTVLGTYRFCLVLAPMRCFHILYSWILSKPLYQKRFKIILVT